MRTAAAFPTGPVLIATGAGLALFVAYVVLGGEPVRARLVQEVLFGPIVAVAFVGLALLVLAMAAALERMRKRK
ncbi:MAG TPA: hypothetical protein VNZ52_10520 [Candidatus Thermoplasmatota archaeon]|nr:hypothetical protein [Candidatus Thermoplasmatota archaeon]